LYACLQLGNDQYEAPVQNNTVGANNYPPSRR
jgi:hypothetical protein